MKKNRPKKVLKWNGSNWWYIFLDIFHFLRGECGNYFEKISWNWNCLIAWVFYLDFLSNVPVNSPSLIHNSLRSSFFSFNFSSKASLLAFRAANISLFNLLASSNCCSSFSLKWNKKNNSWLIYSFSDGPSLHNFMYYITFSTFLCALMIWKRSKHIPT